MLIHYKFSKDDHVPSVQHPRMLKPSVKMAMASSHTHTYAPLLLLFLLACSCRASSGHAVDPTCPPAKASAVAVETSDRGGPRCQPPAPHVPVPVFPYDVDPMQFALNLEYTEAEFFLHAAFGVGLDQIAPNLTLGGPPPVGAMKANLDEVTWRIAAEFGLQEVGHIRCVKDPFNDCSPSPFRIAIHLDRSKLELKIYISRFVFVVGLSRTQLVGSLGQS